MKAHEPVDACDALAVDTAVTRAPCDLDLDETRLTEKALNKPLERGRVNLVREDVIELRASLFHIGEKHSNQGFSG